MIVELTQKFIDTGLIVPPGKPRMEFVDSGRSGLYVLTGCKSQGQGAYYLRYKDASGKTAHEQIGRTTDITLADARKEAKRLRAEIALGADPRAAQKAQREVLTLDEFYEQHLKPFCSKRKRSWNRDEQLYRIRIKGKFGNMRLNQITRHQIQTFHSELLEGGLSPAISPASCDLHLRFLKHAFNLAIDWNLLAEKNPASRIPLYNVDNRVNNIPSSEELSRLLSVLQSDDNRPVCLIAMFLAATGLRVGEALSSLWSDVDLQNRTLIVRAVNSKSKRLRSVPLNDFAISVLKQMGTEAFPHVFTNLDTQKKYTTISKTWHRLRNKAGLPKLRCHDLRHLAASLMINSGASLYTVQQVLGHSNPSVTERYAHLSQRTLQEASNRASAVIQSAMQQSVIQQSQQQDVAVLMQGTVVDSVAVLVQ